MNGVPISKGSGSKSPIVHQKRRGGGCSYSGGLQAKNARRAPGEMAELNNLKFHQTLKLLLNGCEFCGTFAIRKTIKEALVQYRCYDNSV